ncbi:MAG: hypothetical protein WD770_03105 [Actinomycetota bacterium]
MGQSAAETVREIEQTRDRLEEDFRELEHRLPQTARMGQRAAGVAVGGGVAGTVLLFGFRRWRKKRTAAKAVTAIAPVSAVIQVLPEKWEKKVTEALEDGTWRTWAAGLGGAWVLFKLAELRQMRRLNQALVAR